MKKKNYTLYLSLLTQQVLAVLIPDRGIKKGDLYKIFSRQIKLIPSLKQVVELSYLDPLVYLGQFKQFLATMERFLAIKVKGGKIYKGKTFHRYHVQICSDIARLRRTKYED